MTEPSLIANGTRQSETMGALGLNLKKSIDMRATVSRDFVNGFEVLVLENSRVRASIIPSLGGRVWDLFDRARERQWIWHREDVPLAVASPGASYDDVWAGGWEELFPNDASAEFEGRALPDHGEWWTTQWSVAEMSSGAEAVVRLVADTHVRKTACVKEFRLRAESSTITVSYRIENLEPEPFHFLFKQHLPIAITSSCRLVVPGGRVMSVNPAFGTLLPDPGPFYWPLAEGKDGSYDLRVIPPRSSKEREFVYVSELVGGWCGIDDASRGASLRIRYELKTLPYLWLFLAYGGWRNCYTAVLEPCTNMPKDLLEATRAGQSARLEVGGAFETSVSVTLADLRRAY